MELLTYPVEAVMSGTPLKVTARMAEPVVYYGDGMHFDGLLAYGAFRQWSLEHPDILLPPIAAPWAVDFDLPLARWSTPLPDDIQVDPRLLTSDGQVWGWCASMAVTEWANHSVTNVRKRPPLQELQRYTNAKCHNYGSGPSKARDMPFPTQQAHVIRWYCQGDAEGIRELLKHVTHIGKLCNHGHGRVLSWAVELGPEERWRYRRLPGEGLRAGIRAPYHHPSREVPCVEPTAD